jgi:hypothetical protein
MELKTLGRRFSFMISHGFSILRRPPMCPFCRGFIAI